MRTISSMKPEYLLPSLELVEQVFTEHENADEGKLVPNYNYLPDDHYSVLGAEMQKYLADQCTREELAKAIQEYWKTAKAPE